MRKHQLKQIMDILKTLYDATAEMKSLLSRGDIGTVIGLLADCQDIALQIGESVEQVHGEGTKTVALLTNFCEELYRASIEVGRAGAKSDFVKRLRNALLAIESCAGDELKPDKLEIAFFPYKAAMWDSFESVWLAAKDDPRCDVHVVPIPYYDRLPGGKLGQAYFDGDQYPSYVPVEDWQKYDVEERRPDVIFIHNAYDGVNRITSLHPDYYAKRLCTLTDMLVYIPYFVCPGDFVPEHLSALPGLLHAHKAIAQNQSIRQSYIREYHEMEEQFGFAGRYGKAEEKFVALGSPKFDKALNAKPEDFELPEAWRRLIEKPDGTKKKAILYNTSISAILHHKEQYLRKLRHVLDMFERNGDVVLWWRPHPLSASTYQSAHPGLVEEYERITAQYRRKGFGIYDDTTDLHRALCLCSAYYGDSSSLEALFGVTGKPIVIQNPNIMDARHSLSFLSVAFDEAGNAYAWDTSYNGLFRLNFKDSSAKLIAGNDHYPGITPLPPYGVLGTHGDEIIAFPYFADEYFHKRSSGE